MFIFIFSVLIMAPKRKSENSSKIDQPYKKRHVLKTEQSDDNYKEDFGEKHNAGKKFIIDKKQGFTPFKLKQEDSHEEFSVGGQDPDQVESPNFALNQLLQQKSKLSLQGSVCWKTYQFPNVPQAESALTNPYSYFGLDLVEEETERTIWTHKASVWKDIVQSIFELTESGGACHNINQIFQGMLACPVRAVPKGPNEPETFKSAKGQSIQHWIMLVPMPADIDPSEFIPLFISEFTALSKKGFIRSAYHCQVSNITKHSGLLAQISATGSYWNIIEKACHKDVIKQHNNCLSEVLLNSTIKEVVSKGLRISKDTNVWSDSIKHYAFGF